MGLSLADFNALTPSEFAAIYAAWERSHLREPWERARFMACSILQPWTKRSLKATDVCRFEWDDERQRAIQATQNIEPSTRQRAMEVVKRVRELES